MSGDTVGLRPRRLLGDESGVMLVELLVAMTVAMLVLGATLDLFESGQTGAARQNDRAQAVNDARVGVYRMTRELRQASKVFATTSDTTANQIDVQVNVAGVPTRVQYQCDVPGTSPGYRRCVRTVSDSSARPVVLDRVLNGTQSDPVFTFSPDGSSPRYVSVKVAVPSRGERSDGYQHNLVLEDGFYLRNLGDQ